MVCFQIQPPSVHAPGFFNRCRQQSAPNPAPLVSRRDSHLRDLELVISHSQKCAASDTCFANDRKKNLPALFKDCFPWIGEGFFVLRLHSEVVLDPFFVEGAKCALVASPKGAN